MFLRNRDRSGTHIPGEILHSGFREGTSEREQRAGRERGRERDQKKLKYRGRERQQTREKKREGGQ